jgi:hypothetical protein
MAPLEVAKLTAIGPIATSSLMFLLQSIKAAIKKNPRGK